MKSVEDQITSIFKGTKELEDGIVVASDGKQLTEKRVAVPDGTYFIDGYESKIVADQKAKEKRSYIFPVYIEVSVIGKKRDGEGEMLCHVGWGIAP